MRPSFLPYVVFIAAGSALFLTSPFAHSEEPPLTAIVATRALEDSEAVPGDLVVFDAVLGAFRRTLSGDSGEFGVVAADAHLLFRTSATATPIVQHGTTLLNVSTLAGAIALGDALTLSPIPGKAMRVAVDDTRALRLAVAREPFAPTLPNAVGGGEESSVAIGAIIVALADQGVDAGAAAEKGEGVSGEPEPFFSVEPLRFATLVRFITAALVTAATVLFAYRMYEKNLLAGITSIGRNPLAKTSIQVMMGANIALVTFVAAAGLAVSILIIVL